MFFVRYRQIPELNRFLGLPHVLCFVGLALQDFLRALYLKEKGNTSHPKFPTIYQCTWYNIPVDMNLRAGIIYR